MVLNIENIVAELETATILELSELAKATEEKFDVSAAAPVAIVGLATGGAARERTRFTAELTTAGDQKVEVIETVCEATGLGLEEAKAVVDGTPAPIKEAVFKEEAEALEAALGEVNASVTVK